ncbi:MAG: hypothetical protein AB1295_02890 [Candidatus Micrarchaeota archaeon]
MVAKQDGRGVPVSQMVRRAASDSANRAADTISERLRQRCAEEPSSGTHQLFALAVQNMEALKPRMEAAKAFLAEARQRRASGELNDSTLNAEMAPVNMALALYKTLEFMLDRANDKAAFQLIGWASGILARNVEAGGAVLSRKTYPSDPDIRRSLVDGRRGSAIQLYNTVMKADLQELAGRLDLVMLPPEQIINAR